MAHKDYESSPFYRKPDKPSYLRRAHHHDYKRPARYMITLHKSPEIPWLASISGDISVKDPTNPNAQKSIASASGDCFLSALKDWNIQYPIIQVDLIVVMPDHIHLCLNVKYYLEIGLSSALGNLMGKASKAYSLMFGKGEEKELQKFFTKGFSERFAPSKTEFELMGTRRLLLIAPMEYESQKRDMKYNYAQQLNSLAEYFASHPASMHIRKA